MERYTRILGIDEQLIQVNCPIVFEKGALLRDNKNETNVLQLQFENISDRVVKATYVRVLCYDIENKLLGETEHKYLDLNEKYNGKFGDREPITIKWTESRKFVFEVQKVIFVDDPAYESIDKMYKMQWNLPLSELGDLKEQYEYEVTQINSSTKCKVRPAIGAGLWQCVCGGLNHFGNKKCGLCRIDKEKLFACWNLDKLAADKKVRDEELEKQRQIEQEQKLIAEKNAEEERLQKQIKRKKATKKILVFSILAVLGAITVYFIKEKYFIPKGNYELAMKYLDEGKSKEAVRYFRAAGEFKDSEEKKLETEYDYVNNHLDIEDDATYNYLLDLIDNGYEDAQEIYDKINVLSFEVHCNREGDDYKYDRTVLSRFDKWRFVIYVHEPRPYKENRTYSVRCNLKTPDGRYMNQFITVSREDAQEWSAWYTDPWSSLSGVAKFKLFDTKGNCLFEKDLEITPWEVE